MKYSKFCGSSMQPRQKKRWNSSLANFPKGVADKMGKVKLENYTENQSSFTSNVVQKVVQDVCIESLYKLL